MATVPRLPAGVVAAAPAQALGLLRIVAALLFTCHGAATLFGVLGGTHGGASTPVGQWPGWWAGLIQLVGGILVLIGLLARPAALLCSGSMAYAYFTVHQQHALWPIQNGGEPAVLYCWIFLTIAVAGPGALALDRLWQARSRAAAERGPATLQPTTD
ncbi:DoxX family protein [Kitasatospora sp. NPDC052896]|uniref:DoxX family protein n=1 Tax=Kitasatospora sp. NPDC052896 TaxID=3364061 RepID=UPI0037C9221C